MHICVKYEGFVIKHADIRSKSGCHPSKYKGTISCAKLVAYVWHMRSNLWPGGLSAHNDVNNEANDDNGKWIINDYIDLRQLCQMSQQVTHDESRQT